MYALGCAGVMTLKPRSWAHQPCEEGFVAANRYHILGEDNERRIKLTRHKELQFFYYEVVYLYFLCPILSNQKRPATSNILVVFNRRGRSWNLDYAAMNCLSTILFSVMHCFSKPNKHLRKFLKKPLVAKQLHCCWSIPPVQLHNLPNKLLVSLTNLFLSVVLWNGVVFDCGISSIKYKIAVIFSGLAVSSYFTGNGPKYWNRRLSTSKPYSSWPRGTVRGRKRLRFPP